MITLSSASAVLSCLEALYAQKGHLQYGEDVNQLQHALQCGALAEQAGATDALVLAAVLHDVGHMLHRDATQALERMENDSHEHLGAKWLARGFSAAVTEPVRLHVQAKRFLCLRDPGYAQALSPLSRVTLQLQGGPMTWEESVRFETTPYALDAVQLRRWDDAGKVADLVAAPLQHFLLRAEPLISVTQSPPN
jgi:phosphonate degradation associated HDIG domain protein